MEDSYTLKYLRELGSYFVPLFTFFFLTGASDCREPVPPQEHFSDGFKKALHLSHLFGIISSRAFPVVSETPESVAICTALKLC